MQPHQPRSAPLRLSVLLALTFAILHFIIAGPFAHAQTASSYFASSTDRVLPPRPCRTDLEATDCKYTTQKLAVSNAGNAIALWTESEYTYEGYKGDQYLHRVMVSRYSATTNAWSTPSHLQNEVGIVDGVGFDGNGNAIAVWSRRSDYLPSLGGPGDVVRYARFVASQGTWTRAAEAMQVRESERSNLSVSNNGDAFIAGISTPNVYLGVYHAASGVWRKLNLPNPNTNEFFAYGFRVASDNTGNAIVIYAENRSRSTDGFTHSVSVRYGRFDAASRALSKTGVLDIHYPDFNSQNLPNNGVGNFAALGLAMDPYGKAMAFWEFAKTANGSTSGALTRSVRSSRYLPSSNTWARKTISVISSGKIVGKPDLAADRFGNVHAVWVQYIGSYAKTVYAKYSAASGAWNTPRVVQSGSFHSRDPRVAVDANGSVFAVWSQRSDPGTASSPTARHLTTAARFDAGRGVWGAPRVIQDSGLNSYRSEVGVDARGRAVVLWPQDTGRFFPNSSRPIKELRVDRLIPQ